MSQRDSIFTEEPWPDLPVKRADLHCHSNGSNKPGEAVLRIVNLDHLRAEGFLQARYFSEKLENRKVKLFVNLPHEVSAEFPGKIVFLDPETDPVNGQFHVWIDVSNQGLRLRPGMRARMTLDLPP